MKTNPKTKTDIYRQTRRIGADGSIESDSLKYTDGRFAVSTYNKQGQLTETKEYNKNGELQAYKANKYDEKGRLTESLLAASVEYDSLLNITGEGTMGYVVVPKINVNLPIYHGTGNDSLDRGVGHLLGSSLPVGGESTHAILTGHSGMASQKMFTDLEQLNTGDVFYLQILNETLAYQVVEINTVLPYDTSVQ